MKKITLAILLFSSASLLFGAFPDEYPIYLGLLGFSKREIRHLANGGVTAHRISGQLPGEYGVLAASVSNVPVYYFRDYYREIENYKSLQSFQMIGKFHNPPSLQDLKALRFTNLELHEFLTCQLHACDLKLSAAEISRIPRDAEIATDSGKERVSDIFRQILLDRLMAYQKGGASALASYEDRSTPYNPGDILRAHMMKFEHLDAYFPQIADYLLEYPKHRERQTEEFFYWAKEHPGGKPVVTLHHVFSGRIGEDYYILNNLVYSSHYFLSSIGVLHLINYADKGTPRTLLVLHQRTLTDLKNGVRQTLGRDVLRANLERNVVGGFKVVGKAMEARYLGRVYTDFPYGLLSRDQR